MRLVTKYYYINDIPVIEMIQDAYDTKKAPLVIFYHGYSNTKDGMMTFGNEIAKKGFRVIMPDAIHHGERRAYGLDYNTNGLVFFEALKANVQEFPQIIQYYKQKDLIQKDYIGVAGMSMGGMTTSLIIATHPEVSAAVVLMGSPKQDSFNQWIIDQYTSQVEMSQPVDQYLIDKIQAFREFFKQHDLAKHPEAVQSRPLLFWHSKQDPVVPSRFVEEFIDEASQLNDGQHIELHLDESGGHKVPYKEMARMAEFFDATLKHDKHDIFKVTEESMVERFG
ncbi:alpha/beta fold hydrolase [Aerococcaceae bacterium WGS1372]